MSELDLLERLLTSHDTRAMSDAAAELGMSLTQREPDRHVRVLDLLHGVRREDDFGRGFVTALRSVLDAFVGALDREVADAELARLAERDGVRDVLIALYEGHRRPSQLATATERAKSQVTAFLKELETSGLVELDDDANDDGRARPRVLTTRGLSVARRLAQHASTPAVSDVSDTVSAVVQCFATLVARKHVARADLAAILDARLPVAASTRALATLAEESQRLGLAVDRDATFWHVEARLQDVVSEYLARATDGDGDALHALIPSLATRRGSIVIRTSGSKDAWSRLIHRRSLDRVEVIGSGEARVEGDIVGPFEVVYDSGIEVHHDLSSQNRRAYIDPADARWIHTVAQSTVPPQFSSAPLEAGAAFEGRA